MAYLDSSNVADLVADIKALADDTYFPLPIRNAYSLSDFGTQSFFFAARDDIVLTPTSFVLTNYAKGLYLTAGNDAIIIAVTPYGGEVISYRNGTNWTYPINLRTAIETEQQARINSDTDLNNSIVNIKNTIAVNSLSTLSGTLHNLQGSITQNLTAHLNDNMLLISGRLRISVTSRTGSNGGVRFTIPNSKVLDGGLSSVYIGPASYSDAPRNGDGTMLIGTDGNSYFDVVASESYANVLANKTLVLFVPPTIIKVK